MKPVRGAASEYDRADDDVACVWRRELVVEGTRWGVLLYISIQPGVRDDILHQSKLNTRTA
jgi:hypothetical protein